MVNSCCGSNTIFVVFYDVLFQLFSRLIPSQCYNPFLLCKYLGLLSCVSITGHGIYHVVIRRAWLAVKQTFMVLIFYLLSMKYFTVSFRFSIILLFYLLVFT